MTLAVAVATVGFYLATAHGYGYFRDELYYLACADHLAAGYVDHPPLLELLLGPWRTVAGDSLPALRALPALAAGATVVLTGWLVRRLGGGRGALAIALAAVATAPLYLGVFSIMTPNAFDVVFWTGSLALVVALLDGAAERTWLWLGLVTGLGLLDKHGMAFLVVGLMVGFVATDARRRLASRWSWGGAAVAALLVAPHLLWQARNGWPTLEFAANASRMKNLAHSPAQFVAEQMLVLNPLAAPIWIAGVVSLWRRDGGRWRALAVAYVTILALMVVTHGKAYYIGPFYPLLFAAGAVAFERATRARWVAVALPVAATALAVVGAPLAKALLPVERLVDYQRALGQDPHLGTDERLELGTLPQLFADQHGWPELAATVARVRDALPAEERARVCIFTGNYGEAAAIDFFGRAYGLPHAISGHNAYWAWGTRGCDFSTAIVIGIAPEDVRPYVETVEVAAPIACPYCMPHERRPILVTHGLKIPPDELWRRARIYV
jgi:dolichyl-phosphate-mannose-protein mannosyltransferase